MSDLRFTLDDAVDAHEAFGFNCGPAALCAVLGKTPNEIRPHLLNFEEKGYMSPSMMSSVLFNLDVKFRRKYECAVKVDRNDVFNEACPLGLMRLQWGGPWMKEGVPIGARYRQTHWVACRYRPWEGNIDGVDVQIFDVNALGNGGWRMWEDWNRFVLPELLASVKRSDGTHWPTHVWEILQ